MTTEFDAKTFVTEVGKRWIDNCRPGQNSGGSIYLAEAAYYRGMQDRQHELEERLHKIFDEANVLRVKGGRMLLPDRIRWACERMAKWEGRAKNAERKLAALEKSP